MKKLCILLAMIFLAAPAMAVDAVTDISINVPSIIVLYYRPAVTFDVTTTLPTSLTLGAAESSVLEPGAVTVTGFSGSATVDGAPEGYLAPGTPQAEATNFWAVRSLGPNNTQVTVSLLTPAITNGSSTITMSAIETGIGGSYSGASVSFAPPGLGFSGIVIGDVRFLVDMSAMTASGLHTGGEIQITAVNL